MSFFPSTPIEVAEITEKLENKTSLDLNDLKFIKNVAIEIAIPICHIVNISLESGKFPEKWKYSKTVPIFKKSGSPLDMNNYRPISIINGFSKILEKVVFKRLSLFLNGKNFFYKNQFGFRENMSVAHAVVKFQNFIAKNLNNDKAVLAILLDVQKAFDSINRNILYEKLENAGVRGITLEWFRSYLTGRKQITVVNGVKSENFTETDLGVLQGSSLAAILYLIYVNDFHNCTSLLSILFADDTTALFAHNDIHFLKEHIASEFENMQNWFSSNQLKLNIKKTNCILFSGKKSDYDSCKNIFVGYGNTHNIQNKVCIPVNNYNESVRLLGVYFENNLQFDDFFPLFRRAFQRVFLGSIKFRTLSMKKHFY